MTIVSKGAMEPEKFMNSIKRYVNYIVEQSKQGDCKVIFAADKSRKRGKILLKFWESVQTVVGIFLKIQKGIIVQIGDKAVSLLYGKIH